MPDIEVFSQVVATLSEQMLDLIAGDKHAFLTDLLQPIDVSVSAPADLLNVICIYGKLESIIKTKALLESKLPGHKEQSKKNELKYRNLPNSGNLQYISKNVLHKDSTSHSFDVKKRISTLNVKKNQALCEGDDYELKTDNLELKTNSDVAEMIVGKDKEQCEEAKVEKNKLHELHTDDLSKTSNKSSVKTVTRSGRKIKKPVFVKNYEELSDSDDSDVDKLADESNQTKENTFLNLNRTHSRGAKRKRGRKSWQSIRRYPNSYSRKSVGKIDPENDKLAESDILDEKVKNTEETVEQSPRKRSPRINLTLAKNLADKKGIKKYYEDRMPFKYFCSLCSYKAKRESHYEKHMELHNKNPGMKMFNCNECDFVAIRKGVLYRHWLTHLNLPDKHALKDKQSGVDLDDGIKDIKYLEEHQAQHKLKPVLGCKLCQFEHVLKDSSAGEGSSIHADAVDVNSRIVKSKGESKDKLYECQQCNYQTWRKLNFVRHQKGVHSNLRPHLCDLCGMAFKRSDGLKAHKESHLDRGQRNLPYPCKLCGKRFKSVAHVKEHSTVHTTTRSFQCDICGQMFKTMNVQRRHVLSVHRKTNWLSCPFCKKSFSSKYTLKRHLNSHIGENVDGLEISTDSTKNILNKISKGEGYQKVGQGQMEDMDENLSAIKTITVTTENMVELTEQLESVTGQIQSMGDIGEVYIQELSDGTTNTVNIVSIKGDELSKILIPSSVPSSQVEDTEMVTEGMKLFQYPSGNISTQITHLESVKDAELENIIPVDSIKQAFCLNSLNQNSSTNDETINQEQPEADDISYETVGGDQMLDEEGQIVNMNVEHIIDEGQIIDAGQLVEFVTTDGQTYRVKWDDAQQGLCLEAQNNESQ